MIKKLRLLLVMGMITVPVILMAQTDPPPGPGEGGGGGVTDAPFDGGVSLLVAAGVAYGLKKVYDKKKEEKNITVLEN